MLIDNVTELRQVLLRMHKPELVMLRNYLKAFDSRQKGHKPRGLMLLDLYMKNAEDEKVLQMLRKKMAPASEDAMRMVINRLYDKVLQVLVSDVNLARTEAFDVFSASKLEAHRLYYSASLLISRGARDNGISLLDRAVKLCNQYEHDRLLPDILHLRHEAKRPNSTDAEFERDHIELTQTIERVVELFRFETVSQRAFKYTNLKGMNRHAPSAWYLEMVKQSVDAGDAAMAKSTSLTLEFRLNNLKVEYYQLLRQFDQATERLDRNMQILDNPNIRTKARLTNLLGNQSQNEIYKFQFNAALSITQKVIPLLDKSTKKAALNLEFLFHAQYYQGMFLEAEATLMQLINDPLLDQSPFKSTSRAYLLACVKFRQADHKAVNRLLSQADDMNFDREGWNVARRFLRIMNSIALNDHDLADAQIQALRQFTREGIKDTGLSLRDQLILKVLTELRKHGYNGAEASRSAQAELDLLRQPTGEQAWDVLTPELVCFQLWFDAQFMEQPYPRVHTLETVYR